MGKTKKANVTITETKDIDENVVYVYNSKQSRNVPSLSPPCLALETYLRMTKVEYKQASAEKRVDKMHGDPKIMINRQEYCGLEKCMEHLFTQFKKDTEYLSDAELSDDQKADAEAFVKADVETVLFGALNAARMKKAHDAASHDIMKRIKNQAQQLWKPKELDDRNMSKLTMDDLSKKIKESLMALSNYLQRPKNGSKWFFGGEKPTKYDAVVFGLLAQFFYEPNEELNLKEFFEKEPTRHVADYLNHIKNTYWSTWDQCCAPAPPVIVSKQTVEKETAPAPIADANGTQKNGEATTPNGAVGDDDKPKMETKGEEIKMAPKAIEESPKTATTPEEKKIQTPVVIVDVPIVADAVTPTSEHIVEVKAE